MKKKQIDHFDNYSHANAQIKSVLIKNYKAALKADVHSTVVLCQMTVTVCHT